MQKVNMRTEKQAQGILGPYKEGPLKIDADLISRTARILSPSRERTRRRLGRRWTERDSGRRRQAGQGYPERRRRQREGKGRRGTPRGQSRAREIWQSSFLGGFLALHRFGQPGCARSICFVD